MATAQRISRWFNVHEEEVGLFVWTVLLLLLLRSAGIFLNNYAETAFLKRYGVEYMPIVSMINAVATFFVMGILTGFMTRMPGARLLTHLFVFCGVSVALIRLTIPLGYDIIYPLLFMLKSQYEVLLALLFWNLANDLFNTRQSKRLFPLITAGGVIGQILSSFATPPVARWLHVDNLLLVYLVTTLAGAWTVQAMGRRYPTLLFRKPETHAKNQRGSMIGEFKAVMPLMRRSVLVKILVVLTLMPNVVIPIMNYQFNYAVNAQFATESGLIDFFGYFRGVLNIISLVILLFVGKLYDRFGLAVALMFHPFNYIIVFLVFFLRFDAVAAMYARISSNVIRTTINLPATAVVTGLFPESYRAMIRPFLRGTVVRIGLFIGSGLILASETLFHPRYLSLVAIPFVLIWLVGPFVLKRQYAGILLGLIEDDSIDLHSLDESEIRQVFRDRRVQESLIRRFHRTTGENRLWYGQLMRSIDMRQLDDHLLAALAEEPPGDARRQLVGLLSDRAGPDAAALFSRLATEADPDLVTAMIDAGQRMAPGAVEPFFRQVYASTLPMDVKARAAGVLHGLDPERFGTRIDAWLADADPDRRRAGIIAAGISRDLRFADRLKTLLAQEQDDAMLLAVLESLRRIGVTGLNPLIVDRLGDPAAAMRRAVLDVYRIEDETALKNVIARLGDDVPEIADLARRKIREAGYQNSLRLVKSLSLPCSKVREALFALLAELSIKDLDVYHFVQLQSRSCFQLMGEAAGVRGLPDGERVRLLVVHLEERVWFTLQTTLRVLSAQDRSGRMKKISRGLVSTDKRQRANSLEALDDILDRSLVRLLMPLLEDLEPDERLAAGRRLFPGEIDTPAGEALLDRLLTSPNWVTLVLTLDLMGQMDDVAAALPQIRRLARHDHPQVSRAAGNILHAPTREPDPKEAVMDAAAIPLTDKILYLKNIEIFSGLSINELAAVAAVTEEAFFEAGETVFNEGEQGDNLFLVVEGNVAVVKDCNREKEIELDNIGTGDYFGEMALFADDRRSATIRVKSPARFLTLHKHELQEIVREYPQIALHVCRVLSQRIRRLHGKISDEVC